MESCKAFSVWGKTLRFKRCDLRFKSFRHLFPVIFPFLLRHVYLKLKLTAFSVYSCLIYSVCHPLWLVVSLTGRDQRLHPGYKQAGCWKSFFIISTDRLTSHIELVTKVFHTPWMLGNLDTSPLDSWLSVKQEMRKLFFENNYSLIVFKDLFLPSFLLRKLCVSWEKNVS